MSSGSESDHDRTRDKFQAERSAEQNDDFLYGPALPPHLLKKPSVEPKQDDLYGPKLPQTLKTNKDNTYGPQLPQHLISKKDEESVDEESESDSDEDCSIGPDPRLMNSGSSSTLEDVERRAMKMMKNLSGADDADQKRESWMLELPPEKAAHLGLGARQFKRKHTDLGDRSVWTETPEDKDKKKDSSKQADWSELLKAKELGERDKEMEKLLKKSKKRSKKESESLLEIHQKKLKKKAKKEAKERAKEGKPPERRPFDRNIDLQANRFDEAQKRSIIKKAQVLNDRFSQGQSKFL